jgi:hypothetical protein
MEAIMESNRGCTRESGGVIIGWVTDSEATTLEVAPEIGHKTTGVPLLNTTITTTTATATAANTVSAATGAAR